MLYNLIDAILNININSWEYILFLSTQLRTLNTFFFCNVSVNNIKKKKN